MEALLRPQACRSLPPGRETRRPCAEALGVTETIPEVIAAPTPADYFEVMTRAVFQAGVSWKQIAQQWEAYREAFARFDPARVITFDDVDRVRVLETPGILRSPRKVEATIANAAALMQTKHEFGSIERYLESFDSYATLVKDVKRRFAFMGEMNVWYWLFRTGHRVPSFEGWVQTIRGEHPRMREMVERARAQGRSPEI